MMMHMTINNKKIEVKEGATILEAAASNGVKIPTLCHLQGVHEFGTCRICSVEVVGLSTLQAACIAKATEGMVVLTNTLKVRKARKVLYELILSDHSQDCLACRRNQSCELQELGKTLGVETSRFDGEQSARIMDNSVSISRDMSKCILCRRCVTACNEVQGVGVINAQNRGFSTTVGPAMDLAMGSVNCAMCGQCTIVCPVGALKETDATEAVWSALNDTSKRTVVQIAPAIRVAIGEEFGYEPGARVTGKLATALHELGFDDVFDTNFTADLTILEEGTEFLGRVKAALTGTSEKHAHEDSEPHVHHASAVLPMITSCSPGWIKYMEHAYPDSLDHLSTCKSPHTMLGALVKTYYAEKKSFKPEDLFVVSVMPCTAKKFEITRAEMQNLGVPNVDAVLTTRELAAMIKTSGIDFINLPEGEFDNPLGLSTGAADIFGVTGGVMEAALRTVYEVVTGRELPFESLHVTPIVGLDQVKDATVRIENPLPAYSFLSGVDVRVAVTSGLRGAKQLMEQVANGTSPYHFIEVMGCPNGCIMGGGQPRSSDEHVREKRLKGLYAEDESKVLRKSHENPYVTALYKDYLQFPNSPVSHDVLHTHYTKRGQNNEFMDDIAQTTKQQATKSRSKSVSKTSSPNSQAVATIQTDAIQAKLSALEAENMRLKGELAETQETVNIFKEVVSSYNNRPK
jgi:NADH-quinone oxidoreductase subunit G/NADP-reducing hydrogenase subunit HndD